MGLFSNIFGNNKSLPFEKIVRFEKVKSDFEVSLGDKVSIWKKPNSNQINLYARGSAGGDGLVATTSHSIISYHLDNTDYLFVENKVVGLSNNSIDLFIRLYADKNAVEQNAISHKKDWIEKMTKKYIPKTSWNLQFKSDQKIGKNDFLIKTIDKSQIEEYYENANDAIWLTDKDGVKLNAEAHIYGADRDKTLRAVFSGWELEILNFKKDKNIYHIELGIKK